MLWKIHEKLIWNNRLGTERRFPILEGILGGGGCGNSRNWKNTDKEESYRNIEEPENGDAISYAEFPLIYVNNRIQIDLT